MKRETFIKEMEKKGIKVKGFDKIPEIKKSPIYFDHEGDLYEASDWFMTFATMPDGRIEPLAKVSEQYVLVQHYEAIAEVYKNIIEEEKFPLASIEVKISPNGGRSWTRFRTKDGVEIEKGDKINPEVVLINSADTTKRFQLTWGAFRMVCSNGMIIPDSRFNSKSVRRLHKTGSLNLDTEMEKFRKSFSEVSNAILGFQKYTEKALDMPTIEELFEKVKVGERQKESILALPMRGEKEPVTLQSLMDNNDGKVNGWQFYNAFTQYTTDAIQNPGVQLEKVQRMTQALDEIVA